MQDQRLTITFIIVCVTTSLLVNDALAGTSFDVTKYGAVGNGDTDDSSAFSKAWTAACNAGGNPIVIVPGGKTFLLWPTKFGGPCKSSITVEIFGTMVAPKTTNWPFCESDAWLLFKDVNDLTVTGSGKIDGQGSVWWSSKEMVGHGAVRWNSAMEMGGTNGCQRPTALRFLVCNNLHLSGLTHVNSAKNHISITSSTGVTITNLHIYAPEDSPNTDGIDISGSSHISIDNSVIGTGDDCIAINSGTTHINISGIACGPGHGISVGSLGQDGSAALVEDVTVQNCNLTKTQNGVRIKTWPGGKGIATQITFDEITLNQVRNPIIIDQDYCNGRHDCPVLNSNVMVTNVTYRNIHGSSTSEEAVSLLCGPNSCNNIKMNNVQIVSAVPGGQQVTAVCSNARGIQTLTQPPITCFTGHIYRHKYNSEHN